MVVTGDGELGFDSGEGAWEIATTSTEGSRRANCPMSKKKMRQRKEIGPADGLPYVGYNGGYLMPSKIEYQLEDKSGASTRGNSSSKSVY